MSSIKPPLPRSEKSITQQSDITIDAEGRVHISFLWDDLADIPAALGSAEKYSAKDLRPVPHSWAAPRIEVSGTALSEYSSCRLCPKECGFDRLVKSHSTCGDFQLRISNSGLSQGDEPMIRGVHGSGIIMLAGCPLKCPSCHNPEKVRDGETTSLQEFLDLCETLLIQGAENVQILSPTVHLPQLREGLRALKSSHFPLPIVLKSSGYENLDQLHLLAGLVDIYLPDFKFGACSLWSRRAGVKDYFERASLAVREMIAQVGPLKCDESGKAVRGVLVRHVMAPLPPEESAQIRSFLESLPAGVQVSLQDNFVNLEAHP